jgi:transposase
MITRAARISARKRNALIKHFSMDLTATDAAELANVSRPCANRWYRHFRETIYGAYRKAPRMSGQVEIDIGFFAGRKAKKDAALVRQLAGLPTAQIVGYRRRTAKDAKRKIMVLGILTRGGDVYTHPIERKDRVTLESVVRLVVEPGSTIFTDFEKGFDKLRLDRYKHESINHSLQYSDKKGKHINGVENFFHEARRNMGGKFRGVSRSTILLHIKEREWRYNNRGSVEPSLKKLLRAAA